MVRLERTERTRLGEPPGWSRRLGAPAPAGPPAARSLLPNAIHVHRALLPDLASGAGPPALNQADSRRVLGVHAQALGSGAVRQRQGEDRTVHPEPDTFSNVVQLV